MNLLSKSEHGDPLSIDSSIFRIRLRSGIWGVTLDGGFYGDYRTLSFARESVDEAARAMQIAGRSVHVVTLSPGGAVLTSKVLAPM